MNHAPTPSRRVIPLTPADQASLVLRANTEVSPDVRDAMNRPLRDLRISVTDRCNFRCSYCMPKGVFGRDYTFLPQDALLSFEEITRVAQASIALGVRKIRITGGEPLLRKNLEILIAQLAQLRTWDNQPLDITLTTNATVLKKKAAALKAAGLKRVTISLDALDDAVFKAMNDMDVPVADVLAGIAEAQAVGLNHIKINMVVKKGTNDDQILPMARYFRGTGMALRFIEFMDVGQTNGWRMDEVLPSAEVIARIHPTMPLVALGATTAGETAQRYGYIGANGEHDPALGEIGVISSVTQAFCHDCNRARLSTEGKVYTCLFASSGVDLRTLLREGADVATVSQALAGIWGARTDRYSLLRAQGAPETSGPRVEMHYIGG
jgi:GTP 3',8-cyclase